MLKDEEKSSATKASPASKAKKTTKASAETTTTKPAKAKTTKAVASKSSSEAKPRKAKSLDTELRHRLINETAHFLSEKRCGDASQMDDWLYAEKLVDDLSTALCK